MCQKVRYESKAEAKKDAKSILLDNRRYGLKQQRLNPYECHLCGGWHLTSKKYPKFYKKIHKSYEKPGTQAQPPQRR